MYSSKENTWEREKVNICLKQWNNPLPLKKKKNKKIKKEKIETKYEFITIQSLINVIIFISKPNPSLMWLNKPPP